MNIAIHPVTEEDRAFWLSLDRHLRDAEFARKVRDRRGYVLAFVQMDAHGGPGGTTGRREGGAL